MTSPSPTVNEGRMKKTLLLVGLTSALLVDCQVDTALKIGDCCGCLSETKPDGSAAPDGSAESVDGNCLPASAEDGADETDVGGERAECADPNASTAAPIVVTDAACGATVCQAECQALVDVGYTFTVE